MDHRTQPEHNGRRQRSSADTGAGELGNDDGEAARITARGNEAIAFVRGRLKQRPEYTQRSGHLTGTATRKCDELEARLAELKSSAARILSEGPEQVDEMVRGTEKRTFYLSEDLQNAIDDLTTVTAEDVAKWAEGI